MSYIYDYPLPDFHGWRPLKPTEMICRGDRFCKVNGSLGATPENGSDVDNCTGSIMSELASQQRLWYADRRFPYWIYRKGSSATLPRRLIMSRVLSNPLPLP